jgi:phage terminase large subunit
MELRLLKHQARFLSNFRESESGNWAEAIVSGFGAGKTHTLSSVAVVMIAENPGVHIGMYSATFDLLKLVNIPSLEKVLLSLGLDYTINKADMIMTLPQFGSKIVLRSMDNPARIIGYEHGHALVDELDTMSRSKAEEAWNQIIARNRQKLPRGRNKVGVGTTPEGYKFVYHKWHKNPPAGYRMIKARTVDNIHLPPEYVQNLLDTYPSQLIEAYLEGEFVNLNGNAVYHGFNRFENNTNLLFDTFEERMVHAI